MAIFVGHDIEKQRVELSPEVFLRHAVCLGASGSGKTVACKVLCEEFALHHLPVIAVDPQGDIASLILPAEAQDLLQHGLEPRELERFQRDVEVVIWTPGSRAGIPLSLDPLRIAKLPLRKEVQIRLITSIASNFTALLGYPLDSNDGSYVSAYLDLVLQYLVETNNELQGLSELSDFLHELPSALEARIAKIISPKKREEVLRKIEVLGIGARRLLFHVGTPLDIPTLLGKTTSNDPSDDAFASPSAEGSTDSPQGSTSSPKTRISVIYLNTLHSQEEKEFFVSQLAQSLYQWMIENPSQTPQALFYIDEIAPYLPPVRKPASKEMLRLLFKQARKYGVCCLFASQNPGDIDYTALAQCSTWVLGRMLVQQDIRKIEGIVRSLQPTHVEAILEKLPSLEPGTFLWLSPDAFDRVVSVRVRWLLTQHETLDEDRVEELTDPLRARLEHHAEIPSALDEQFFASEQDPPSPKKNPSTAHRPRLSEANEAEASSASPRHPKIDLQHLLQEPVEDEEDEEEAASDDSDSAEQINARQALAAFLEQQPGVYTIRELTEQTELSETTLRKLLKQLQKQDLIASTRVGRSNQYWLKAHNFSPTIGLFRPIQTIPCKFPEEQALKCAKRARESGLFGLVSREHVEAQGLRYLLLWRVKLRYIRRIGLLKEREEQCETHLYYHAQSTQMLSTAQGRLRFIADSEQTEVELGDIQTQTTLQPRPPSAIGISQSIYKSCKPAAGIEALCEQRFGGEILSIEMAAFPYWSFTLKRGDEGARDFYVDAYFGHPFLIPQTPTLLGASHAH
ncbi:MAG: DUF853 family protein [Myxococcales bacterium]|nr:DUF853 family protein [Myxococcales bacterium]